MARWRLTVPHYLLTDPPTEWEHKETSRETGRQHRVVYKVPRYLDPKDPADYTSGEDVIVCNGNNPERRDVIFLGDPTPDMEPVDAEAKKITKSFIDAGKWRQPLEGEVLGEQLIKQFMEQIAKAQIPAPISSASVDATAFAKLQEQVAELMDQNSKLQAQILERPVRRA